MKIEIKNLHCKALIGCRDWEKETKQDLWISVVYHLPQKAYLDDDIEKTVSYSSVASMVKKYVESFHTALIESLAFDLVNELVKSYGLINVSVTVRKKAIADADFVEATYTKK